MRQTPREGRVHAILPPSITGRYKEHLKPDGNHLRWSDVRDPDSPPNQSRWTRQQRPGGTGGLRSAD